MNPVRPPRRPLAHSPTDLDRRQALKLLPAGFALALAGCSKPEHEIVPYVDMPERLTPGEPLYFASALPLDGLARGVIVTSVDGRPIKISGNPRHPASLGATDIFAEAEVFSLYDPARSRTLRGPDPINTWDDFLKGLTGRIDAVSKHGGRGLRIVTGPVSSPTLKRQFASVLTRYPHARWHAYSIADRTEAGIFAAFGAPLRVVPRFDDADVIVTLGADPLGPGPMQLALARAFAGRRKPGGSQMPLRLYSLESVWTLTGANADHRLGLAPADLEAAALALVARLGGNVEASALASQVDAFVAALATDIEGHRGRTLLLPGEGLDLATQAAVHAINRTLDAPIDLLAADAGLTPADIESFLADLADGAVSDVLFLDCNPVYDLALPASVTERITGLAFSAHIAASESETSAMCSWHLPMSHPLEAWSDLRAFDGTASIVQPLIRPLYDTRSVHEIVALLDGAIAPVGHDIVRDTWRAGRAEDVFDAWWRGVLHDGVIAESRAAPAAAVKAQTVAPAVSAAPSAFIAVISADPCLYDGRQANNAWLQECPKPLSKAVWRNAIAFAPDDAQRLKLVDGDVVRVAAAAGQITGTVAIARGQATGTIGLTRGYGRTAAGPIGNGLGYNAALLAPGQRKNIVAITAVTSTGERDPIPATQGQFSLAGSTQTLLPLVSVIDPGRLTRERAGKSEDPPAFLHPHRADDGYRWAMAIDTALCIGCNACIVACDVENNVPVVGPDEVAHGRIMHWLRIDRYELGTETAPRPGFEPVPCMQCEEAPCEPVCPVEASVHDDEGLNVQVYNRCIGTRLCQSNCPYKVRRFNWFGYGDDQAYANLGDPPMAAQKNPDVSVRARGIMEKCTYCVQRISRARREAEKTDIPIPDGGVVTACQAACPTRAIRFGNLEDPQAEIHAWRSDPRHFVLLEELGTKPRTTYLARLVNSNPALDGGAS